MPKYSEEQWKAITGTSCVDVAKALGMEFDEKRSDKSALRVANSGGLFIFRDGKGWYCHSTGEKGGCIDLVMRERSCNYKDALDFVIDTVLQGRYVPPLREYTVIEKDTVKREFNLPERESSAKRVYGYLINARKIDYEIVKHVVTKGLVFQEKAHGNCCFVGYDKDGKARYCSMRGTLSIDGATPYKGEVSGSEKVFGWAMKGGSRRLYVFEAAIDAMSHATLAKICGRDWKQDTRLSLGGCYPAALVQHLNDFPNKYDDIIVCTDNDEAGNGMLKRIIDCIPADQHYNVTRKTPITKDWNEDLKAIYSLAGRGTDEYSAPMSEQLSYSMHSFYCEQAKTTQALEAENVEEIEPE